MYKVYFPYYERVVFIHILNCKINEFIARKQNINAKSHNFFEGATFFREARLRKRKIVVFLQFEI